VPVANVAHDITIKTHDTAATKTSITVTKGVTENDGVITKSLKDTYVNFPTRHWYDRPARNEPSNGAAFV